MELVRIKRPEVEVQCMQTPNSAHTNSLVFLIIM